jgi:hypothetical protein
MAVVQISKLQVRRGIKSQTGLPQLAAGEFGWAVDSQQLYIGNGAVSEGAPYVGNTEILTEKSNIFSLLPNYSYKGYSSNNVGNSTPYSVVNLVTGPAGSGGVTTRTLQSKLDDFTSVRDFGALGNGTADDTSAIQLAIDQLFLNTDKADALSRRVLYMPAGNYLISDTLYIPSNTTIIGEGRNNTVITMTANNKVVLQTKASSSLIGQPPVTLSSMDSNNSPKNIRVVGVSFRRGLGLLRTTPLFNVDCLSYGVFDDCQFASTWINGNDIDTVVGSDSAISIRGNGAVTTEKVWFNNCHFHNATHAVYSDYNSKDVVWNSCYFANCYRAFTLAYASNGDNNAQTTGPQFYTISESTFDSIDAEAIRVYPTNNKLSRGHKSNNNRFYDVGNSRSGIGGSYLPAIVYGSIDCESNNDFFQRSRQIDTDFQSAVAYIPDVVGIAEVNYGVKQQTLLGNTLASAAKVLLEAPMAGTSAIYIDYTITLAPNFYRNGTISIVVNKGMSAIGSVTSPVMTEKFNSTTGDDGNIRFYVQAVNLPIANSATNRTQGPTLLLQYSNTNSQNQNATINFKTRIISDIDSTYV